MFLREPPQMTLAELEKEVDFDDTKTVKCSTSDIVLNLDDDEPVIRFGSRQKVERPAGTSTLDALAEWFSVPTAFTHRLDRDMRQYLFSQFLERNSGSLNVTYGPEGVRGFTAPGFIPFPTREIAGIARRVISPEAQVVEWWWTPKEFRLDVIVPTNFKKGTGGDKPQGKQVGDITLGGLRFGQTFDKRHLSPWVQEFFYRLVCTNGMEGVDLGEKVDGRGNSTDELVKQLEVVSTNKFNHVEDTIKHYYDLRNVKVARPTDMIMRMAREGGLPDRTVLALAEMAPSVIADMAHATMFEVVNTITNAANDPEIRHQGSMRRSLERTGGHVVSQHAARCHQCFSKLT